MARKDRQVTIRVKEHEGSDAHAASRAAKMWEGFVLEALRRKLERQRARKGSA